MVGRSYRRLMFRAFRRWLGLGPLDLTPPLFDDDKPRPDAPPWHRDELDWEGYCVPINQTPPHCDRLVLHAPGECDFCDHYPSFQRRRILDGVRFTGHSDTGGDTVSCPSEVYRPSNVIHLWGGNRPRHREA